MFYTIRKRQCIYALTSCWVSRPHLISPRLFYRSSGSGHPGPGLPVYGYTFSPGMVLREGIAGSEDLPTVHDVDTAQLLSKADVQIYIFLLLNFLYNYLWIHHINLSIHLLKGIWIVSCHYFSLIFICFPPFPLSSSPNAFISAIDKMQWKLRKGSWEHRSRHWFAEVSSYWLLRANCVAVFLTPPLVTPSWWFDHGNICTMEVGKY